jgi:hypothetical protein
MVTFRVSPEEYGRLEAACTAQRSRSVSDLTRGAVLRSIQVSWLDKAAQDPEAGGLAGPGAELERIENCIQVLSQELQRLQSFLQLQKRVARPRDYAGDASISQTGPSDRETEPELEPLSVGARECETSRDCET